MNLESANKLKFPALATKRFEQMDAYLPKSNDPEILVLKGHLLVEEILESLIKSRCQEPGLLEKVEIGFFLKCKNKGTRHN